MDQSTLVLAVDSTQVNSASAALDKMAAAGGKAEGAADRLTKAAGDQGKAFRAGIVDGAKRAETSVNELARATTSLGASSFANLDKATTSLGATAAEASRATREVNTLRNALSLAGDLRGTTTSLGATGPAPQRVAGSAVPSPIPAGATAAATAFAAAAGKANAQVGALGKTAKDTAFKNQQLAFQLQDFFVQVQAGGSPLTALIQQGSQLSGTFGGVGNAFRAVLGLLTPFRLAVGGVVGVLGGLAVAFLQGQKESRAFADAIVTSGNFAGQTEGKFRALTSSVAESTKSTVGSVREFGQALLSTGEIGPQAFNAATQAAVGYAQATGKTADEVAKDFAALSRAPSKFAAEANRAFNFLSVSQFAAIRSFEENGRAADAQGIIYDALIQRFGRLQDNLGTLDRVLLASKNVWSSFWNSVLDVGRAETIDQKIARTNEKLAALQTPQVQESAGGAAFVGPRNPRRANAVRQSVEALQAEQSENFRAQFRQSEVATAEALRAETEKRRIAAFQAVEGYKQQAKGLALVNEEIKKAQSNFKALEGTPQAVPAAEQTRLIADIRKRNSPAAGRTGRQDNEPEQLRRATLEADISGLQDALAKERDALQFHNRFLQGEYQAGNLSLRQYYQDRRASIAAGVDAEIAELQREKERLAQDRDAVAKKDPSEAARLQSRIDGASAEQERLRIRASQDVRLANQEEASSFKFLSDQVTAYKANLLQLQGDEVGAAKLRAQQTIEQASILSRQTSTVSTGEFSRIDRGQTSSVDVETLKRTLEDNISIQRAREETNRITETLQIEEERIALQLQTGSITETVALQRIGEERRKLVTQLEEQVVAQEKVSASRPNDTEFALSTQRARLELEKLKAELDPLADKFRSLFQDSGADAIADFLNGTKSAKAAINDFGKSIATQINNQVAKDISASLFGKEGTFGGVFSKLFGSTEPKQGSVTVGPLDASAVTSSLTSLQTAGIDPTTSALTRLQVAADAAARAVSAPVQGGVLAPVQLPGAAPIVLPTTGDFARADRATETAADSAQALSASLVDTRTTAQQFAGVLGPATTILASMGQAGSVAASALSLLPAIIAATSTSSAASSGGGFLSSIFGSSGGASTAASAASAASSSGGFFASVGNFFSSFFHTGGVVGEKKDMRPVNPGVFSGASKYHSGGIVGGEALASLKANEVPAILLGGPKGVREEVLTANDPRHKDNLSPILLKTIVDAKGQTASVLSVIASGGKGGDGGIGGDGGSAMAGMLKRDQQTRELSPLTKFLIGSPETVRGLVSELSKEADFEGVGALRDIKRVSGARELGGPVSPNSLYRVNERKPELLEVAGKQYLMTGSKGGEVKQQPQQAPAINVHVNQQFAPGTDRRTINQGAAAAGAAVQTALVRFN